MPGVLNEPIHIQTSDEEEIAALVALGEDITIHDEDCELIDGEEESSCSCAAVRFRDGRVVTKGEA